MKDPRNSSVALKETVTRWRMPQFAEASVVQYVGRCNLLKNL